MHTKAEKKDCRPNGRPAEHAPQRADDLFHSVLLLFKGAAVCNRSLFKFGGCHALNRMSPAPNNSGRDRDPLVTGTGIGDCLHYSHVTQPIFKSRIWSLVIACFYGIEEIILDRPFPGEFLWHFHFMQGAIAHSTGFDYIGSEIVNQGPGRAVNFQAIAGGMGVDTTKFERAFRAVREAAKH